MFPNEFGNSEGAEKAERVWLDRTFSPEQFDRSNVENGVRIQKLCPFYQNCLNLTESVSRQKNRHKPCRGRNSGRFRVAVGLLVQIGLAAEFLAEIAVAAGLATENFNFNSNSTNATILLPQCAEIQIWPTRRPSTSLRRDAILPTRRSSFKQFQQKQIC